MTGYIGSDAYDNAISNIIEEAKQLFRDEPGKYYEFEMAFHWGNFLYMAGETMEDCESIDYHDMTEQAKKLIIMANKFTKRLELDPLFADVEGVISVLASSID